MSAPPGSTERIARNATFKVLVQATRLASLLLVIVTARVLGPVEFGKFTFAYALATVLGVALEFGVWPVLTRAVARDPASAADQWAAATTLKLGLLGLVGPFYLAAPLVAQRPWDTTAAVWLLGLAIALQGFVENGVAVFTGLQRLDQELLARLVEKSVLVTVGFAALGLGAGLLGVSWRSSWPRSCRSPSGPGASTGGSPRSADGGARRPRGCWPGSSRRSHTRSSSAWPPHAWLRSPSR